MAAFEASLDAEIGQTKEGLSRTHEQVSDRLQVRGWRRFVRDITLTTRKDKKQLEQVEYDRARVEAEEARKRQTQDGKQQSQRQVRVTEEIRKARLLEKSLQKAEERREREGWAMRAGKGVKAAQEARRAQEQQENPPALPKKQQTKPDLQDIRQERHQTRREREPDIRDRRSQGEKQREDAQRRPVDQRKDDSKGRSEQAQPIDMDAVKRDAQEHRKKQQDQKRERGQDHGDDFEI